MTPCLRHWPALLVLLLSAGAAVAATESPRSVAFYYGDNIPWSELRGYDWVVVEPGHAAVLPAPEQQPRRLFAYVSLGEVNASRPWFSAIPDAWRMGSNAAWGGTIIDQCAEGWPALFAEQVIAPLWAQGFRHFFVDTLDSYQIFARTPAERAAQEAGELAVLRHLHARFPGIGLMVNRGFEILPEAHGLVEGVAAESLFRGWNAASGSYVEVPAEDREWLLQQLRRVREEYGLPVAVIDYLPPAQRDAARDTARAIAEAGFVPWVSDAALDMLGVSAEEVMPRRILVLREGVADAYGLMTSGPVNLLAMPLQYLGYVPEFIDAAGPLPTWPLRGRYAGIVLWLERPVPNQSRFRRWLLEQMDAGMKVAVLQGFGFGLERNAALRLGFSLDAGRGTAPVTALRVERKDPLFGFEAPVMPERDSFFPLRLTSGQALLRLRTDDGRVMDAAALTPWGGYILSPYVLQDWPVEDGSRWVVQPIDFLQRALQLTPMPVPDVTTESGRRLLMVHTDGDGLASRAEYPGSPFSGEVLQKEIYERYPIPATVSVIEAEISPTGLHPELAPQLERIARAIFALPNVEMASHSYSHPFFWNRAEASAGEEQPAGDSEGESHLRIPGYRFSLEREITGSVAYLDQRLAPRGKRTRVFLWTGDCNPGPDALRLAAAQHLQAVNGGDTLISRRKPSLSVVGPLGIEKEGQFQVFAPNQNENVYTNLWTGPFYGYRDVVETFELTDHPRRLKPVDIYFHFYSGTKLASVRALQQVFDYALERPNHPVFVSDYAQKVLDFNQAVVVRNTDGWRLLSGGALREWRLPAAAGAPDLSRSINLIGYNRHGDQLYLHASAPDATVVPGGAGTPVPFLADANGRVEEGTTEPGRMRLRLNTYVAPEFALSLPGRCEVSAEGQALSGTPLGNHIFQFKLSHAGPRSIEARCDFKTARAH